MIYFFLIYSMFFISVIKIYSLLFQLTGLSRKKSWFQVASILTSTGFYTKESEIITLDNTRRSLAFTLMIFGYVSTVVSIVTIISVIIQGYDYGVYVFVIVSIVMYFILINTSIVTYLLKNTVVYLGNILFYGTTNNSIFVMHNYGNKVLAEVTINEMPEDLKDVKIGEIEAFEIYNIDVLAILRKNSTITTISLDNIINKGDKIVIYGDMIKITYLFRTKVQNEKIVEEKKKDIREQKEQQARDIFGDMFDDFLKNYSDFSDKEKEQAKTVLDNANKSKDNQSIDNIINNQQQFLR